jgi:hypothetical protein
MYYGSIPGWGKDFSSPRQISVEASCSVSTVGYFSEGKAAGESNWPIGLV